MKDLGKSQSGQERHRYEKHRYEGRRYEGHRYGIDKFGKQRYEWEKAVTIPNEKCVKARKSEIGPPDYIG